MVSIEDIVSPDRDVVQTAHENRVSSEGTGSCDIPCQLTIACDDSNQMVGAKQPQSPGATLCEICDLAVEGRPLLAFEIGRVGVGRCIQAVRGIGAFKNVGQHTFTN